MKFPVTFPAAPASAFAVLIGILGGSLDTSGASVTRTYNDLGLIETLVDNANRTTTWHYDKTGRARALTLPNGQTQVNAYDDAGRLTGRVLKMAGGGVLAAFGWDHDAAGNVLTQSEVWTGTTDRPAGTRTTSMTYHDSGWLHTETITAPGEPVRFTEYLYDDAANREFKIVSENGLVTTSTDYDYNPANQLESWTERDGAGATLRSAVLGFDERGNRDTQTLTLAGGDQKTTSYSWDYQNRLVGVTDPQGGQHAYAYDYRTRRIARSEPGGATAVTWSGGLSLAEYSVAGLQSAISNPQSAIVEYRRGPDMGGGIGGLLHSLRDGTPKYNLGNGRGDVVAQSDATGALTWTASYDAFGKRPVETGTNADRQRANTKEEDPTGLLWEHFRYRDLETGVWLSRDPAGFVDGPNLYAYVRQNPWTFWDPAGLSAYGDLINASGNRIANGRPLSGWAIGAVAMAWNAVSFGHAERMDQISDDWSNGDITTGEMLVANGKSTLTASKDAALTFGAGGTLGKAASLYDKAETGAAVASDLADGDFKGAALNLAGELGPGKKKGGAGSELGIKSAKETAGENAAKSTVYHGTTDAQTVTTKGLSVKERDKAAGGRDLAETRGFSTTTDKATAQAWAEARAAERGGKPVVLEADRSSLPAPRSRPNERVDPSEVRIDVEDYPKVGPGVFRESN